MYDEISYLKNCDAQINALKVLQPNCERLAYLREVVRPDILTRITAEELTKYEKDLADAFAERNRLSKKDLDRMAANKDSQSI